MVHYLVIKNHINTTTLLHFVAMKEHLVIFEENTFYCEHILPIVRFEDEISENQFLLE
jgi:hypothetical protein